MIIHTIISWHVQMMLMNGFGVVIWSMWVMLGQICGWDLTTSAFLICSRISQPKSYQM
jgi:hypothetical protein